MVKVLEAASRNRILSQLSALPASRELVLGHPCPLIPEQLRSMPWTSAHFWCAPHNKR